MRKDRETLGVAGAVGGWEPVSQRGGALGSTAGLLQAQHHVLLAGTRCCPPSWLSQDEQIALLVGEMLWPPPVCGTPDWGRRDNVAWEWWCLVAGPSL